MSRMTEEVRETMKQIEKNMFTALNQVSFSQGVVVNTLKKKGVVTEDDLKAEGENLNEVIQQKQVELSKTVNR